MFLSIVCVNNEEVGEMLESFERASAQLCICRGGHGDLRCCGVDGFFNAVMR